MSKTFISGTKTKQKQTNNFAKSYNFKSSKTQKNFNYHQRLPFKIANIEFKYIWNLVGFVGITITLLLILQNLTAYSSNFSPKLQTVRLITNFNQESQQSQKNVVQEFGVSVFSSSSSSVEIPKSKNLQTSVTKKEVNPKETKKETKPIVTKTRIKKNLISSQKSKEPLPKTPETQSQAEIIKQSN